MSCLPAHFVVRVLLPDAGVFPPRANRDVAGVRGPVDCGIISLSPESSGTEENVPMRIIHTGELRGFSVGERFLMFLFAVLPGNHTIDCVADYARAISRRPPNMPVPMDMPADSCSIPPSIASTSTYSTPTPLRRQSP